MLCHSRPCWVWDSEPTTVSPCCCQARCCWPTTRYYYLYCVRSCGGGCWLTSLTVAGEHQQRPEQTDYKVQHLSMLKNIPGCIHQHNHFLQTISTTLSQDYNNLAWFHLLINYYDDKYRYILSLLYLIISIQLLMCYYRHLSDEWILNNNELWLHWDTYYFLGDLNIETQHRDILWTRLDNKILLHNHYNKGRRETVRKKGVCLSLKLDIMN